MNDLIRRANIAFLKGMKGDNEIGEFKAVEKEHEGKQYILIKSDLKILEVYRVTVVGQLKKLKRYPKELND